MRKLVLLVIVLMVVVVSAGCQQSGLSEEEVRSIVREEVTRQLAGTQVKDIVAQEVTAQLTSIDDIVAQEVSNQLNSLDVLVVSRLLIKNEDGQYVIDIGAFSEEGDGYISIRNAGGQYLARLGATAGGGSALTLYNYKEKEIVFLGSEELSDMGVLVISNSYGDDAIALGAPDGDGELVIIDRYGNVVFVAP